MRILIQRPAGFTEVKPVTRAATSSPGPSGAPASLTLATGQFFTYALPQGWRVGEDGQFALTLIAPDNHALTVMVGNAGHAHQLSAGAQYAV